MSSADVPCVSDVILGFNVFLIDSILPLRVGLTRNVMERLICQISILNLVFQAKNLVLFIILEPVFVIL